ncbi:MAG: hypothetical protein LBS74_11125 [Oscillospiraceae bacterium]|jgi:phage terminase large subunit-like protein|nr:hypothetical protein [Oscillospiraceae bacterium]
MKKAIKNGLMIEISTAGRIFITDLKTHKSAYLTAIDPFTACLHAFKKYQAEIELITEELKK